MRVADRSVCESRIPYGRPGWLPETILQAAWRRAGERRLILDARDGRKYRVLYPGRPGDGRGPDFLDALLERDDGVRLIGDIEVHVRASGWASHGHQIDNRYNGVAFHIAAGGEAEALTEAGRTLPLLLLKAGQADRFQGIEPHRGEAGTPLPPPMPFFDLKAAGDQRFLARSSGFEVEIAHQGPEQALFAGVLECLGYPRNRGAFRHLADRLSWEALRAHMDLDDPAASTSRLLLWASGLGPRPLVAPLLSGRPPVWSLPGGRPDNHPRRRITGFGFIAARWVQADGPATFAFRATQGSRGWRDLRKSLTVMGKCEARALIGEGRAGEIAVNALLPFAHAWGRLLGDDALSNKAMEFFRLWSALPENAITSEALSILGAQGIRVHASTAREQQGLQFLYRSMTAPLIRPGQLPLL